jgi:pimeloyl-ACP methyl ester carboxylesterase
VNKSKSGYAPVNGLKMYYEIWGLGKPLVLIHGGAGATENFAEILPELAASRPVIAVDLQAHGRTADIDRPLRYELMADDVAALLEHLGMERADLMGYSLGGGVALRTAIQHPGAVRKLVALSSAFRRDGWYPEVLAAMARSSPESAAEMKQAPMYRLYSSVAPRPEDWPVLFTKLGELLRRDYDWSSEVAAMKTPTMVVIGDADSIKPSHAVEFFGLLGGGRRDAGWDGSGRPVSRLAILPGTTHYDSFSSSALPGIVESFLDSDLPKGRESV